SDEALDASAWFPSTMSDDDQADDEIALLPSADLTTSQLFWTVSVKRLVREKYGPGLFPPELSPQYDLRLSIDLSSMVGRVADALAITFSAEFLASVDQFQADCAFQVRSVKLRRALSVGVVTRVRRSVP